MTEHAKNPAGAPSPAAETPAPPPGAAPPPWYAYGPGYAPPPYGWPAGMPPGPHGHPHHGCHAHPPPAPPAPGHPAQAQPPAWGWAPPGPPPWAAYPAPPPVDRHVDLLTGLAVGAAAAYLLSNEQVQRTLIRSVVSLWTTVQGGLEELKERVRDAEAELSHAAGVAPETNGAGPHRPDGGDALA